MTPADLDAIQARIRAATGPDRELDADIAVAFGHKITWLPPGDFLYVLDAMFDAMFDALREKTDASGWHPTQPRLR